MPGSPEASIKCDEDVIDPCGHVGIRLLVGGRWLVWLGVFKERGEPVRGNHLVFSKFQLILKNHSALGICPHKVFQDCDDFSYQFSLRFFFFYQNNSWCTFMRRKRLREGIEEKYANC